MKIILCAINVPIKIFFDVTDSRKKISCRAIPNLIFWENWGQYNFVKYIRILLKVKFRDEIICRVMESNENTVRYFLIGVKRITLIFPAFGYNFSQG